LSPSVLRQSDKLTNFGGDVDVARLSLRREPNVGSVDFTEAIRATVDTLGAIIVAMAVLMLAHYQQDWILLGRPY